ncbi:MAG: hypothetical protein JNM66_12755 [Bryobacterales bacterium]|nr:hypothetical protein [Bryobacterales bacterium]
MKCLILLLVSIAVVSAQGKLVSRGDRSPNIHSVTGNVTINYYCEGPSNLFPSLSARYVGSTGAIYSSSVKDLGIVGISAAPLSFPAIVGDALTSISPYRPSSLALLVSGEVINPASVPKPSWSESANTSLHYPIPGASLGPTFPYASDALALTLSANADLTRGIDSIGGTALRLPSWNQYSYLNITANVEHRLDLTGVSLSKTQPFMILPGETDATMGILSKMTTDFPSLSAGPSISFGDTPTSISGFGLSSSVLSTSTEFLSRIDKFGPLANSRLIGSGSRDVPPLTSILSSSSSLTGTDYQSLSKEIAGLNASGRIITGWMITYASSRPIN